MAENTVVESPKQAAFKRISEAKEHLDVLIAEMDYAIESHREGIAKWSAEKLSVNPFRAMSWSADIFKWAAEIDVFSTLASHLKEHPDSLEACIAEYRVCVLRDARRDDPTSGSTSFLANLADRCKTAAVAAALVKMERTKWKIDRDAFAKTASLKWHVVMDGHYEMMVSGVGTYRITKALKTRDVYDLLLPDASQPVKNKAPFEVCQEYATKHALDALFEKTNPRPLWL